MTIVEPQTTCFLQWLYNGLLWLQSRALLQHVATRIMTANRSVAVVILEGISPDEASKLLNIIDGYSAQKKWDSKGLAFIASTEVDTDDEDPTVEFSLGLCATTIKLKVL